MLSVSDLTVFAKMLPGHQKPTTDMFYNTSTILLAIS